VEEQRAKETTGLVGVRGDGACGKIGKGTWETRRCEGDDLDRWREDITAGGRRRESDRLIVAGKPDNAGGAKGPDRDYVCDEGEESRLTESTTGYTEGSESGLPWKLSSLRSKLGRKAKDEPKFRFYSLYGHISREDTLLAAWARVSANDGGPGEDGMSIGRIERSPEGVEGFLGDIRRSLLTRTYRTGPVKRKYIEKENGKWRPLGIPNIRDRVVQMATLLILEPIFEADFEDCSYGFRPGRSCHQALTRIRENLLQGFDAVYDADLKGYFDSIPHEKLMACVRMRVSDRSVLTLIRMWLQAPVVDEEEEGPDRPRGGEPERRKGTPQGGVISPLLSNLYLHWFDTVFYRDTGPAQWANARLVRYADDFVVLARYISPSLCGWIESKLEGWLGLEINREKTRVVNLWEPEASLDFLGFTFRYDRDKHGRSKRYLNVIPSRKALKRERRKLREMTDPSRAFVPLPNLIEDINRHLRGWKNYFCYGYPRQAFRAINHFARERLLRHLRRRSQRPWHTPKGESAYECFRKMGLVYL
jgi:RNA-directed DNA polymerase